MEVNVFLDEFRPFRRGEIALARKLRESQGELGRILLILDRDSPDQRDRTRIHLLVDAHDGNARFGFAIENGLGDG